MSNERERLAREWAERIMSTTLEMIDPVQRAAAEHILATTTEPTMADVKWDAETHYLAGAVDGDGHEVVMFGTFMGTIRVCDVDEVNEDFAPMLENTGNLTPNGKRYELVEVTDKPENPVEPSAKTMDEYTLSERADMVGMWAGYNRHEAGGEPTDFVIITGEENEAGRVPCYNPGAPTPHAWAPDPWMLTPRFDMARAWSTDGEPCAPTVSPNENVRNDQTEHPETLDTLGDYEDAPVGTIVAHDGYDSWVKTNTNIWACGVATYVDRDMSATGPYRVLRWGWGE